MSGELLTLNITKMYPEFCMQIKLEVNQGEFFSLIGPSGCGKTTLLRLIAGLAKPDHGYIKLNGNEITALAPDKRNIGLLFQDLALFPHLNVTENIEYGLKVRKLPRNRREIKIKELLALFELEGVAKRAVDQLSGGEKQRVALARVLAPAPSIVLLDEPFSAIDYSLRLRLRQELKELQQKLQFTTIFVTHQQEEALALSDRVAVMQNGSILQQGAPTEIYNNPETLFVAEFLGNANLIPCQVESAADGLFVNPSGAEGLKPVMKGLKPVMKRFKLPIKNTPPGKYQLMIRPEDLSLGNEDTGVFYGEISSMEFHGFLYRLEVKAGGLYLKVLINKEISNLKKGDGVWLNINYQNARLLKDEGDFLLEV